MKNYQRRKAFIINDEVKEFKSYTKDGFYYKSTENLWFWKGRKNGKPFEFHAKSKEYLISNKNVPVKIDKLSADRNHVLYLSPYQLRVLTGMCSKNYKKSITFYFSKRQVKCNLQQKDGYLHYLLTNNL